MGCRKVNLDDRIFRFIYVGAMRDAVIQLAYEGPKKWLMESEVLEALQGEIKPLIDKVLRNEYATQNEYDEDFLHTTINICEYVNDKAKNNNFTFGNAQKLVNIMLKYFYIISYKNDVLKGSFRFCHCPMDQQLLESVWNNRRNIDCVKTLGKRDYFLKSWGHEDFEMDENGKKTYPKRYILFQQAVRCIAKNINSLEYDYYIW